MKAVRQARLELSGGSTPDQLKPVVKPRPETRLASSGCYVWIQTLVSENFFLLYGASN